MTTHDFEVPYADLDMGDVPRDGFVLSTDTERLLVEGHCPRCRGRSTSSYPRGYALSGSKGSGPGKDAWPADSDRRVHMCECGHPHPGQPQGPFVGCGAQWRLAGPKDGTT